MLFWQELAYKVKMRPCLNSSESDRSMVLSMNFLSMRFSWIWLDLSHFFIMKFFWLD